MLKIGPFVIGAFLRRAPALNRVGHLGFDKFNHDPVAWFEFVRGKPDDVLILDAGSSRCEATEEAQ